MTSTEPIPEPVSAAPDTEAPRQQAVDAIERELDLARSGEGYEANAVAEEIVRRCWPDVAGLRADLYRACAERDARQRVLDEIREHLDLPDTADLAMVESTARAAIQTAHDLTAELDRVSGARPIPDDAAERVTYALFRMAPGPFRNAPAAPLHALGAPLWKHTWRDLSDDERAEWLEYGRGVLDQLGFATPTTGPAPAAADGPRPKRSEWLCPNCKKPPTPFGDDQDWMCDEHRSTPPAAPQAPAEPKKQCAWWWDTKQCPDWAAPGGKYCDGHQRDHNDLLREVPEAAREDTASPDDYGDNERFEFLRGPCSCQPVRTWIHVPGTYCGDTQYEELLEAVEAGAEDQSAAVHLVLNRLAAPSSVPQEEGKP